jgi:16S rRNA (guanine966-N2)-methyltransferase
MRVVAGSLRSRTLRAPKGDATRPTTDRVRESLFAVLGDVTGLRVLDLYAGSGALAIEALSRGAASAVCVESARPAIEAIEANRDALGLRDRLVIVGRRIDVAARGLVGPFDLVFADPPWADVPTGRLARDLDALTAIGSILDEDALVVIEHAARDAPPLLARLILDETRRWGDTAASFYRPAPPPEDPT